MPGFLVHVGATVLCAHAGQAQPTVPNPRVTVSGQPTVTITAPYVVAGCALPPPPGGQRSVRDRAMGDGLDARDVERPAAGAARQPGDLRADRDAAADHASRRRA